MAMAMAMGIRRRRRRNWGSGLPSDLLGAIFIFLPIRDRVRVRAVCHGWSVASAESSPGRGPANPQSPWLVGGTCADVYALSEHRSYRLSNITAMSARCVGGSSHGWLVFHNDSRDDLRLLNPITGVTIHLPSQTTLPKPPNIVPPYTNLYFQVKVFFSDDHHHRHDSNIMVFASCCSGINANKQNRMAYAKAGDQVWTPIGSPEPHSFRGMADFAFHKGKLYGVLDNNNSTPVVVIMDIKTDPTSPPPRYIQPRWHRIFKSLHLCTRVSYHLMDSVDGEDLLLVLSTLPPFFFKPYFWVMKLDSEAQRWLPLPRLKETAIFLAGNISMALSTRGLPELKENCIYFTRSQCHLGFGDEGIFDRQNGTISPLFRHHYSFTSSLHHWFIPAI